MVRLVGRRRRAAVAGQVGAHDGVPIGQQRDHPVPRDVGARVAVEQQEGRTGSAVADAQRHVAELQVVQGEAVEHDGLAGRAGQDRRCDPYLWR